MATKKKVTKKRIGRPTVYRAEYADLAYKMCLLGATDKELAAFFKVVESTINKWKIDHKPFSESITRGKEYADMKVAGSLFEGTSDKVIYDQVAFKLKRTIYDENGKKIRDEEYIQVADVARTIPADFRNQQFWLKNRKSNAWRDKQEIDHTTGGDKINLSNVPTDTLKSLLNAIGEPKSDS